MTVHTRQSRPSAAIRGLAALLALAAFVLGVPAALVALGADPRTVRLPSPHHLRDLLFRRDDGTMLLTAMRTTCWTCWAVFTLSVLAETAAALTGRTALRLRAPSPLQQPAALLVATLSAALTTPNNAAAGPAAHTAATATADRTPSAGHPDPALATPADTAAPTAATFRPGSWSGDNQPRVHRPPQVTVRQYDSLWRIAERHLGTGLRWTEIYHLNAGRPQPDGQSLTDPDHVEEGWTLLLPADATPAPPDAGARLSGGVVVRPGDTLSEIAERHLGTSGATDALFLANAGRLQPDGRRLTNPDRIYPGWRLLLPQRSGSEPATPPVPPRLPTGSQPPAPQPKPSRPAPRSPAAPPAATPPRSAAAPATRPGHGGSTVPGRAPGTPSPAPSATPGRGGDGSQTGGPSRPGRPQPPGVWLPGGWVDAGLAAAITAAAGLVWARRRRRYTPRPPSPRLRLDEAGLTRLPPVVAQVRRGLRRLTGAPPADAGEADQPSGVDGGAAGNSDKAAAGAVPVTPGLGGPLDRLWPPAGLGLTGPGAEAAARGLLAGTLATGGVDDPHARGQVVVPAGMLATLLGAAAASVPATPRLTVTAGLAGALDVLEAQTLHRTRIVYEHEADTVAGVRQADPSEQPLPPVVLLAHAAADHERARITAVLAQGERLDIHGVLLGGWPDGDTVRVAEDGTTTPAEPDTARHGAHPADVGRLTVLTPGQAADLLTTLAESHGGPPPAARPAGLPPHPPTRRGDAAQPSSPGSASAAAGEAAVGPAGTTQPVSGPPAEAQAGQPCDGAVRNDEKTTFTAPAGTLRTPAPAEADRTAVTGRPDPGPAAAPGTVGTIPADQADADTERSEDTGSAAAEPTAAAAGGGRARVFVLGLPRVDDSAAGPGEPLRAKSLELLVYLAVQDGAAAGVEAILEDLLPDAPARKAPYRLHTYVYSLRRTLARCGGPGSYLTHPAGRYALNADTVEVDLWQMQAALADATTAAEPAARVAALRRAVELYRGPLADGCDYEWAEPYREAIRRQALDAHLALADALTQTGQPADALTVLTAAIGHAPYEEAVYQQAMRVHAALGQPEGVRAVRRELTRRLEDIDAEPSRQTLALAERLVHDLDRRPPAAPQARTSRR
jgi:DNA-binding SARP family transcriptional activator/nucleoid-associated protein YgaU